MTSQLLIYESAIPVSNARHGEWSVEVGADYSFSKSVNSVPLMAVEFPHAAAEYAIVFSGTAEAFIPTAILGMREENLYLGAQGAWQAKYIPAFVRRYPFVFSSSQDGKTFTLCIDEAFPGFNQQGRGQRLFGEDKKPSAYVSNVLKFLEDGKTELLLRAPFARGVSTHGTGCTYSAAITGFLARGLPLAKAVQKAKDYVTRAIHQSQRASRHWVLRHTRL